MQDEDYYSTSDLALAAAILCKGYKLDTLNRTDGRRVFFVFRRNLELDGLLECYWRDVLEVNPKSYFDAIKHLKTRLYSQEYNAPQR